MTIFDTTHSNKEYTKVSNEVMGKSYSLIERIKRNGIGSSRMAIAELSEQLKYKKKETQDTKTVNIEMRPKGIIVHLVNGLDCKAWLVPFYKLHVYNTACYSIHADGNYIKLKKDKSFEQNKKFLSKMIDEKIAYLNLGYYDG